MAAIYIYNHNLAYYNFLQQINYEGFVNIIPKYGKLKFFDSKCFPNLRPYR